MATTEECRVLLLRAEAAEAEVKTLRQNAAEYVQTQAHHMTESWRTWFFKRFRLKASPPYGVVLEDDKT